MLPSLHVYEAWVFGHNRIHHGHTVREEMDYVWHPVDARGVPRAVAARSASLHRLKWSWLGAGVYYGWDIWWSSMMRFDAAREDRRRREAATARSCSAYAAVVSAALLGARARTATARSAARCGCGSRCSRCRSCSGTTRSASRSTCTTSRPTSRGTSRREWTRFKGQMEGTTILHMPGVAERLLPQHLPARAAPRGHAHPVLPPARGVATRSGRTSATWCASAATASRDYLRATRACKLYDFATHRWIGLRRRARREAATRRVAAARAP